MLEVDGLAFDRFWRFDTTGLADARTATPHARFRVAAIGSEVVGYHVTGRAGTLGYLQRLAVHPDRHGHGIGTALVGDSLDWCHRKGCRSVLVNTQEANQRALSLYEHLGFRLRAHRAGRARTPPRRRTGGVTRADAPTPPVRPPPRRRRWPCC